MAHFGMKDMKLEIAAGRIDGKSPVNKFGRAPFGIQQTATDIWDRADATPTQQIWVAPTQARIHDIVSTSTDDDGAPVGIGARTIQVFGLTAWNADEENEILTMNGTTNVPTTKSYVIIHRLEILTKGASGPNVGVITATAQTDGSISAQINAGIGQTQMAIYGVPSTKIAYVTCYYASLLDAGGTPSTVNAVNLKLLVNTSPDVELLSFITKHQNGLSNTANSYIPHQPNPYLRYAGPAIIKLNATAFAEDSDVSGGFDIILEDVQA